MSSKAPPVRLTSKAAARRLEIERWWRRRFWPCVMLTVDPGSEAGAALVRLDPWEIHFVEVTAVSILSRDIERLVQAGIDLAAQWGVPFVLALESWGAGGNRGLSQWLGLGEARGAWRRAYLMALEELPEDKAQMKSGTAKIFKPRIIHAAQTRWRSKAIDATGKTTNGKWERFDSDGWKEAAKAQALETFGLVIESPDAAEAAMMVRYFARSDELGKVLPKSHLVRFGLTFPPEDTSGGKPKRRRRR